VSQAFSRGEGMDAKPHWERIYQTFDPAQLSWYEEYPRLSLELIHSTEARKEAQIIDVGGGTSRLVDELLAEGYQHVTVLDIVGRALELTRQRLRARAAAVTWIEADITTVELPRHCYDVWHDRAVFHFLMQPEERRRYVETMRHAVRRDGHVIVATFTLEGPTRGGPTRCSGLKVVRYSPASLADEFGAEFELVKNTNELHRTPLGVEQALLYCSFKKR
jgi:2-polyprenyl-3-methyl-5-hydroxy-6-metoxy-1,4-benzoquinol methylase